MNQQSNLLQKLSQQVIESLPYTPLPDQVRLIGQLLAFAVEGSGRDVFVLNGFAGTGKTSIMGAVIKTLTAARRKIVVLAPTGRAAKVAENMSGHKASTIHKRLFRGNSADPSVTKFFLAQNTDVDTLFIVDEASLITDRVGDRNSLLQQLVNHVYSARGCRMILMGDEAQLPPVGQEFSTAMQPERLESLGLDVTHFSLNIPVRQKAFSGILHNATMIREFMFKDLDSELFQIDSIGYEDVEVVSSGELDDRLSESYSRVGEEETLIITRSNKRANNFNKAIRNMLLGAEEPLQSGDRLIISKNDYYWSKLNKLETFIANGDVAIVEWVGKTEKMYGRYFTDVELRFPSSDVRIGTKIMLRSLVTDGPSIPRMEMERFYNVVLASADGEASHRIKFAMEDPYYNSLQAKYAYCVTCHKSQGGQWKHVYIDMGGIPRDAITGDFYRWLYTSFTRATEKVFLINPGSLADTYDEI